MAKPDAPPLEPLEDLAALLESSADDHSEFGRNFDLAAQLRRIAARLRAMQFVMPGDDDWDAGYNTALSNVADAAAEKP